MKKIILGLAAVAMAVGSYATDSAKAKKSPEQMANKRADKLKTELTLSDEQRGRVYTAVLEKINKTRAIKEKYKGTKEKQAMHTEMKAVHDNFEASMKSILSAEQFTKWQDLKAKQKEKHKGKGKGKHKGSEKQNHKVKR